MRERFIDTPEGIALPRLADRHRRDELSRQAGALGVPADYGDRHGLRVVAEARVLRFIGYDLYDRPQWLAPRAARAWFAMRQAAAVAMVELHVVSAFRSVDYQFGLLQRKLDRGQSMDDILAVSAAPGYSEHHTGRALDLTTPGFAVLEEEFEHSPAFAWLQRHAPGYGFHLSFPRDNPHGIAYEPWHWCWRPLRRG
ncbi:M15 family metallopeptidase [Tahibacter amnicola]|uniref:D-alanyl-D-alanine carboxypeptidase family protein n=1 Tax=Tahibacter amnicola TaxID=2976241 RepID=A0ABY6BJ47_9GAMM|nr:M15 family metallopeptidase [Tahibacter amnicola]UXI69899.1 D-alanyl-D-alanine carboxypeptidase family protein [Tahibacter amnicola]